LQPCTFDRKPTGIGEYLGLPIGIPAALKIRKINEKLTREKHCGEKRVRI
jgi:hypothetical protein